MLDIFVWLEVHPNVRLELETMECSPYDIGLLKITMTGDQRLNNALCVRVISLKEIAIIEDHSEFIKCILDEMYVGMLNGKRQEYEEYIKGAIAKERPVDESIL